jgi:ribosomal protein S27E
LSRVFTDIELLEVSTCAIPCNPGAVSQLELNAAKHEFLALKEFIEHEEEEAKKNAEGKEGDEDPPEDMEGKVKVTCQKCGAIVNVPKGGSAKCPKCGATVSDSSDGDGDGGKETTTDHEGETYLMIDAKQVEKITTIITDGIEKIAQILENQTVIGKLVEDINEKVISVGNIVAELKPKETSGDEGKLKEDVTALKQMLEKMQSLTQK